MADDERAKVAGRQTLEFDLLDAETQKKVIECIQERGKISVILEDRGVVSTGQLAAFQQMVD
ncbi:hypothetical protein [uncultured Tateyamaria sp.]|uniref:ApyA family aminopyruvatide-related RiPP n=1 Tax=uncultured Tateyamaria sp. TaxID=455651 RepID=UPI0026392735|nr:hypothetical protein [uncultured Tateyamaria sp.]